jgi:hypothetical protein
VRSGLPAVLVNGKLRDECLNVSWFWNLFDARRKISDWKTEYNSRRPHSSLGYLTRTILRGDQGNKAVEKTRAAPAWKTPLAFPTFPPPRRRL